MEGGHVELGWAGQISKSKSPCHEFSLKQEELLPFATVGELALGGSRNTIAGVSGGD